MDDTRPRILIFAGKVTRDYPIADELRQKFHVDVFDEMEAAMAALRSHSYHAVFADVGDFLPLERGLVGDKSSLVLNTIGEGVCIVDPDGRTTWSNRKMRGFTPQVAEHVRQVCVQALSVFSVQSGPISNVSRPRSKKYTFQVQDNYFEMICSPVVTDEGEVQQVVAVVWDATSGRRLQGKIDAIDSAGRELSRIESEAVAKLSPGERLRLLQEKIIKYSKNLMRFDHFAVRLLDKRTGKLEVVIAEGLPSEALEIDLYAQPEGNGISGYVAATGRSYICHDTEKDPRYVLGLRHCKSSLTVPLKLFDKVVGVYNIESESVGAFNEDDRQFAEIFGRYVGMALNILNLLVTERCAISGQITDSVVQEMALPMQEIVTEARTLMEEYIGDDTMRGRLNRIIDHVESIRESVKHVAAGPNVVLGVKGQDQAATDPRLKGKRILVADDEPNIRKTIHDILVKAGCVVEMCKDGYESCTCLEQDTFDLVISDIKMPYRNGYEIFAAARRQREDMPVILMTGFGYDPHHSIVRASQDGLSSVMFKPFKVDQMLEEVYKALGFAAPAKPAPAPGQEPASQSKPV